MYYNNLFQTDFNNELMMPTLVLCRAYNKPIGILEFVQDFSFNDIENEGFKIGFSVCNELQGRINTLFNEIQNFKLVYIPEWQRYYQIQVSYKDNIESTVKTIEGIHLCEAELSQLVLNGVEINTEADIIRDAYAATYIYYPDDPSRSLLHRVLRDKAPNYSIKYVSPSLCQLVRSFSINGESIDDFLRSTLATEINCIVEYDSMDRSISLYDTLKICEDCGYRGDYNDEVCPKCGSSNIFTEYGQETGIIISTKNLAQEITVDTDKDSVKTCFTIAGGDDMMDAAIRAVNPNGTNQLYAFNKSILADMPQELRDKLEAYDTLHETKQPEYRKIMQGIFDLYDEILYYETEMTAVEKKSTNVTEQLNNLKASVLGEIGVSSLSDKTSKSVVDNAVLSMARLHLANGYYVKIANSVFMYSDSGSTWTGKFTVYHTSDEEEAKTNDSDITLTVTADYETFVQQKIDKALGNKDAYNIEKDWALYSLDYLKSFESAYQSCLEILMQQGLYEANAHSAVNKQLYDEYYTELMNIQAEMAIKESIINTLNDSLATYEAKQQEITTELNFKNYLGEELYDIFSCYRRDEEYNNSNYISDGLTNAELLQKAEELLESASVELYKACQEKYTITGTISNFLLMPEFKDIRSECCLGNWLYIQTENGDVYKLRLNGISGNYSSADQIELTFSNAYKSSDPIDTLQDTIAKASSLASSYQSVARQAVAGGQANQTLSDMHKKGLNVAQYKIMNADNQKVLMDEHGLLCREFDEEGQTYLPEQMRIISNLMCFTDDNWKTVKQAIGKIEYTDPETDLLVEKYGVICDTLVATDIYGSKFVGGAIYSENYWRDNKKSTDEEPGDESSNKKTKGTFINLNKGTFTMADGNLTYDGATLKITGDGAALDIAANNAVTGLQSELKVTSDNILAQVSNLRDETSAKFELTNKSINACVKSDNLISEINLTDKLISLKTGQLEIDAGNFKLTKDGKLVINTTNFKLDADGNVEMSGRIDAQSGKIGDFEITDGYLKLGEGWGNDIALLTSTSLVIQTVHALEELDATKLITTNIQASPHSDITGTLNITGIVDISEKLTVNKNLYVTGQTLCSDNIYIDGGRVLTNITCGQYIDDYLGLVLETDADGNTITISIPMMEERLGILENMVYDSNGSSLIAINATDITNLDTRLVAIEDSYATQTWVTNNFSGKSHSHSDYALVGHSHSGYATVDALSNLASTVAALQAQVSSIKSCTCSSSSGGGSGSSSPSTGEGSSENDMI